MAIRYGQQDARRRYIKVLDETTGNEVIVNAEHVALVAFNSDRSTCTVYLDSRVRTSASTEEPAFIEVQDPQSMAVIIAYFKDTSAAEISGRAGTLKANDQMNPIPALEIPA